jgi:SHS family lactate transporter-like MFS transporter
MDAESRHNRRLVPATDSRSGRSALSAQRNALLASFLGWTFDAFDYFVLTFLLKDIAASFGKTVPDIALTLTLTLAMRPVGALIVGMLADRYGRRIPMMLNIIFYAVASAASGLAPSYGMFVLFRMLFGIGMGGQWGVSASLVLESITPKWRGVLSGFLHQGYSLGNFFAALAFLTVYPAMAAAHPAYAWRVMFFIGGLPALLSLFVFAKVEEPDAWREHRSENWRDYARSMTAVWQRFLYLVLLLSMMGFISHGTQDLYPRFLQQQRQFLPNHVAETSMFTMIGAMFGGVIIGYCSDRFGRRRAMIGAALAALAIVPLWIAAPTDALIVVGGFLMQFCVQGAWGIIPAHMNELSPGHMRGFLPGFAYQLGMLIAGVIPTIQAVAAEHSSYSVVMGTAAALALVGGMIVIGLGPEAHGIDFRKTPA